MGRPVTVMLVLVLLMALVGGAVAQGGAAAVGAGPAAGGAAVAGGVPVAGAVPAAPAAKFDTFQTKDPLGGALPRTLTGQLIEISDGKLTFLQPGAKTEILLDTVVSVVTESIVAVSSPALPGVLGTLDLNVARGSIIITTARGAVSPVSTPITDWDKLKLKTVIGPASSGPDKVTQGLGRPDILGRLVKIEAGRVTIDYEGGAQTLALSQVTTITAVGPVIVDFGDERSSCEKVEADLVGGTLKLTESKDPPRVITIGAIKDNEWANLGVNRVPTPTPGTAVEYDTVTLSSPDPKDLSPLVRRGKVLTIKDGTLTIEEQGKKNAIPLASVLSIATVKPVEVNLPAQGSRTGLLKFARTPDGTRTVRIFAKADDKDPTSKWDLTKDDWKRLRVNISEWKTSATLAMSNVNQSGDIKGNGKVTWDYHSAGANHWGTAVLSGSYEPTGTKGKADRTIKRDHQAHIRINGNFQPRGRWYWYGLIDGRQSTELHYHLRTDLSAGVGYHVKVDGAGPTFDFDAGPNWANTQFGYYSDNQKAPKDGAEVTLRLGGVYEQAFSEFKFTDTFSAIGLGGASSGEKFRNDATVAIPLDHDRLSLTLAHSWTLVPDQPAQNAANTPGDLIRVKDNTWSLGLKYDLP